MGRARNVAPAVFDEEANRRRLIGCEWWRQQGLKGRRVLDPDDLFEGVLELIGEYEDRLAAARAGRPVEPMPTGDF